MPYAELVVPFILSGVGMALFFAPVANVVLGAVRREEEGKASGANNAIRELGGVFGVAVLASIFTSHGGYASPQAFVDGLTPAIYVGAAVVAARGCRRAADPAPPQGAGGPRGVERAGGRARGCVTGGLAFELRRSTAVRVPGGGTRAAYTLVPARRQARRRPAGLRAPVLPAGRPRRVGEHPLCLGSDGVGVEQAPCGRLLQLVLVLPAVAAVRLDDQVELPVGIVEADRAAAGRFLEVDVPALERIVLEEEPDRMLDARPDQCERLSVGLVLDQPPLGLRNPQDCAVRADRQPRLRAAGQPEHGEAVALFDDPARVRAPDAAEPDVPQHGVRHRVRVTPAPGVSHALGPVLARQAVGCRV